MVLREKHSIQGQGPPAISQRKGDLQQLISQTITLLSSAEYSEKSIGDYTYSGLSRLIRFVNVHYFSVAHQIAEEFSLVWKD